MGRALNNFKYERCGRWLYFPIEFEYAVLS
jgi:hypothetical protein